MARTTTGKRLSIEETPTMAELVATQGGADIENGTYPATLLGISVEQPTAKSPNQKEWLKWLFVVDDGSETGVEMVAPSSMRCTAKSKTRAWIEAVLGRQLANGETVVIENLKALDCFVLVGHDESGFAKIEAVMPLPKRTVHKGALKPAPPAPPDGDDDGVAA
jgi:hypothetical protein